MNNLMDMIDMDKKLQYWNYYFCSVLYSIIYIYLVKKQPDYEIY